MTLKNLFKKQLLLLFSLLLLLSGCTYQWTPDTTTRNRIAKKKQSTVTRRSCYSDADRNARGGCSKNIRTKKNYLKPAALKTIFIGMEASQVKAKIGEPHNIFRQAESDSGLFCDAWQYYLDKGDRSEAVFLTICTLGLAAPMFLCEADEGEIEIYWLYFYNNKLIQCSKITATTTSVSSSGGYYGNSGYSGASGVTGYGEISKTTGRVRNNVVSGYYRSNGTYVKSYARS